MLTSKMLRSIAISALLVSVSAFFQSGQAQTQSASETVKPIKQNIYLASGSTGSNNGIIIGQKGVIVIDTGITTASEQAELAEIAKITPKKVEAAIITHSDGDHVNGLAVLPQGITIIAQENCKAEMKAANDKAQSNAPQVPLPTKTIAAKGSETIDGIRFQFLHIAPAHTSGDLIVYLPAQKIVFTGDIISGNTPYPLIHLQKNGSSEGWIKTATTILALDADTFVSGHGDIHTRAEVHQHLEATKARRAQIQQLVAQGKSLDEVREAVGEPPPAPGGRGPQFPSFTEVVYQELTAKR